MLYIGISNTPAWIVSQANTLAAFHGWTPFIGLQLEYSLIQRTIEAEFFPMAKAFDLAIAAWSPLAMGVLTGRYLNKASNESRFAINPTWGADYLSERNQKIAQTVVDIAKKLSKLPSQVALNWLRQQPATVIPVIGAKNEEQLKSNLQCLEFTLSHEDMETLNQASKPNLPFPQEFLQRDNIRKIINSCN